MTDHTHVEIAAAAAAGLVALAVGFQVALAAGARWGAAAYGGRFAESGGRLPPRYRLASAVAALALTVTAWLILVAGSVIGRGPVSEHFLTASMWVAAALFALNTAGNLSGKHPIERFGASTVTGGVAVLCLLIAVVR